MSKKDKNIKNNNFTDKFMAVLLAIAVVIVPLIVRIRIVPVGKYEYGIIRASKSINDMFSYNKAVAICIVALVMVIYLAMGIVLEEKRVKLKLKTLPSYVMYGYIGLCLLSSIVSKYTSIAFWGISERYEGFFVLLSYAVFFIIAFSFADSEKNAKLITGMFSLSVLFIGIISTLQVLGHDIWATTTGSKMILGQYYDGQNLTLKFESAYGTLYNPNCLGMYGGMMSAFMLVLSVLMPVKDKFKYCFAALFMLAFICMLGSDSVGGLLGFSCAAVFALLIGIVKFFKNRLYKKPFFIGMAAVLAVLAVAVPTYLFSTNAKIIQKVNVIKTAISGEHEDVNPNFYEDVRVEGDTAIIVTKGGDINITATDGEPVVEQNGTVREVLGSSAMEGESDGHVNTYRIDGLDHGELQIYRDKLVFIGFDMQKNQISFLMRKTDNGLILLDKFGNDAAVDGSVPHIGFNGIERIGSGRGYIWSRSIPLLLKNIIIGKGPDSFALEFPQAEITAKLRYFGNPYIIVDKPHSVYLQTGISTGVLSLLAIIALVVIYLAQTAVKLVKGSKSSFINALRLACACGVIAYMAAGATTDSVVSVAPLFWIMIGTGYGINTAQAE